MKNCFRFMPHLAFLVTCLVFSLLFFARRKNCESPVGSVLSAKFSVCFSGEISSNVNLRVSCRYLLEATKKYHFLPDQLENENFEKLKFTRTPEKCGRDVELLVLINSAAGNVQKRNAIRETWKPVLEKRQVAVYFVAGMTMDDKAAVQLLSETESYQDLILIEAIDEYRRLTIKNVMMYKWMRDNCQNAIYLMKCDDDMFVNPYVMDFVREEFLQNQTMKIFGSVLQGGPQRGTKWAMPSSFYPSSKYPQYLAGAAILQSREVTTKLLQVMTSVPTFGIDDVLLGGIAAALVGAIPTSHYSIYGKRPLPNNPKDEKPVFAWMAGDGKAIRDEWHLLRDFYVDGPL